MNAKKDARALLRARPRSEHELRSRLRLKGHDEAAIDAVISALKRANEIDDARFARLWIESRMYSNPAGDIVLQEELKAKGLGDAVIDAALAEKAGKYDEYKVAMNMAVERFAQLRKIDRRKALKRLYDFLVRRGFNIDTVQRIIDELVH